MPQAAPSPVVPGSAAPPAPGSPLVSIVIPVRDGQETLPATLESVARLRTSHRLEVVVVDDASRDASASIGAAAGARVVPCDGSGVSDARNTGARAALGEIVFFVDADVVLPPDAVDLVVTRMRQEGYDAVTGRLSREHRFPGFASQYKNLWMAYTYESLPDDVGVFYTSAAAVRRDVFLALGGFTWRFERPSVEDTAFGQVLVDHGHRVRSEKRLAVEHLKSYALGDVLRVDYMRSRDLTTVFLRRLGSTLRRGNTSSVPTSFILSAPLPAMALGAAAWGAVAGSHVLVACGAGLLVLFWGCNGGFLRYLLRHRGLSFFLRSHAFLPVDALAVMAGVAAALLGRRS